MTNTVDRFAIVAIPPGPAPNDALMVGPLDLVMQNIPQTQARADALEELEFARLKADQISTMQNVSRGLQIAAFCDSLQHITRRMDALVTRRAERARRDAEEAERQEQQQIADALSKLPDPDNPAAWSDDGELTTHEPSQPEDKEQLEASEHNDAEGDLPPALTQELPPITGTDPELSGSREPTARNPVSPGW